MSLSRYLFRRLTPPSSASHRHLSTTSNRHHDQEYLPPTPYINSWKKPQNPKEAAAHLAFLRRDYGKKVKEMRKAYIQEMEVQRLEKARKDEARKEALRIANEERRLAKDAKRKAEAIERQAAQEEFRQMLMKERAEKLEYWRMREMKVAETKKEKKENLRHQSSLWVEESKLDGRILDAMTDTTSL